MKGGIWPFGSAPQKQPLVENEPPAPQQTLTKRLTPSFLSSPELTPDQKARRDRLEERQKNQGIGPDEALKYKRAQLIAKKSSQLALVASVAGSFPGGGILAGALGAVADLARANAFNEDMKRYAREINHDIVLTSALLILILEIKKARNLVIDLQPVQDELEDIKDEVDEIKNNTQQTGIKKLASLPFAESKLKELKVQIQNFANNVHALYTAVDLEKDSKGITIKQLIDEEEQKCKGSTDSKCTIIKNAWDAYISAQRGTPLVVEKAAPTGARRKTRKSRRRRSRKGKTFRRKKQ